MSQLSYSLCITMFHSLWQCALLMLFYFSIQPIIKRQQPAFKRNILFGLLITQLIISGVSFNFYYSGSVIIFSDILNVSYSSILLKNQFIEKNAPWILLIYSIIICFQSSRILLNWFRFKQICKANLQKPSIELKLFTIKKAKEFGINKKVSIWFSHYVSTPLTFGFFKPVILLPVALLNQLTLAEAESLIIHELTHIKNNDYLLNWFLVIIETLFFFNPFIKVIANKIKLEREKNCDVQVLHFNYPVINYAETLLKAAKFKTNINYFPLAAVYKNKQLLQRIHFFSGIQNMVFSKKRYTGFSISLILFAIMINLILILQLKRENNFPIVATQKIYNSNMDGMTHFSSAQLANVMTASIQVAEKEIAEQAAKINQQQHKLDKAAKAINILADEIAHSDLAINFAIPVADIHTEEKEVLIKEESSGTGEAITKAYKLTLKKGKWNKELVYVIKEVKRMRDSICYLKDSVITVIPAMQ